MSKWPTNRTRSCTCQRRRFWKSVSASAPAPVITNGWKRTAPSSPNSGLPTSGWTQPKSSTSRGCRLPKSDFPSSKIRWLSPKKRTGLVSESGRKKGCELLRIGWTFTTIWISSLFLKPWGQWEIPTRGWESIFLKMRYHRRESRWNISCVVRLTKETPRSCTPQGTRPTKFGCRGAEPGLTSKTRIRTHKFQDAKMRRRVLGYDINALYPSTMEVVAHWAQALRKVEKFIEVLQRDRWFGFRRGGHRGAKRVMDEVRRNAAVVLQ